MKANGWPIKTLGELCTLRPPKAEARKRLEMDSLVSFLPMEDLGIDEKYPEPVKTKKLREVQGSYTYFANGDVLLAKVTPCFQNGKLGIARGLANGVGFGSSEFFVLRPHSELDSEYLYYFLSRADFREEGVGRMGGAVGLQRVPPEFVLSERLLVPPLPEQRRIVVLLDEAFAGIATAKANAEKNLQNARELFESHLEQVFTQRDTSHQLKRLDEVCEDITVGHVGSMASKYTERGVPFLRSQNIRPLRVELDNVVFIDEVFHKALRKSSLKPGDVAIVRTGYPGIAAVIPPSLPRSNCSDLVIARPGKEIDAYYLAYFFNSDHGKRLVAGKIVGAAQKHFNVTAAKLTTISLPSTVEQRRIVLKMDNFGAESKRLEILYQQKLAALDALKKSLLHQAFTGQLALAPKVVAPIAAEGPLLRLPGISTNDFHAAVLAMSYKLHDKHGNLKEFGHVKAEKISHMIEAHLGIDLGRTPVKDAAGPNDFPHFHEMAYRAEKAKFFKFSEKVGNTYLFEPLRKMEQVISRAQMMLGQRQADVEKLLQWMLPLTWREAEVVATVYAAWNNLLLDGRSPTDEEIVYESRENWHPEKMKIKRENFFAAIEWLRNERVVPEGKGKRVLAKGEAA